jgi:hypothetical protein
MDFDSWHSKKLYEHPSKDFRGISGFVEMSTTGAYRLRVGASRYSCPQDWAAKIHKSEQDEESDPQIGRPSIGTAQLPGITLPDALKNALEKKAAALGLSVPDARRQAYLIFSK